MLKSKVRKAGGIRQLAPHSACPPSLRQLSVNEINLHQEMSSISCLR